MVSLQLILLVASSSSPSSLSLMTMPRGIVADDVFVDEDKTKLLSFSSFLLLFGAPLLLNFFLHGVSRWWLYCY